MLQPCQPFLRLDDPEPQEILTDAFVHVLADRGLDRFSVGALARWMKVSPAAVLKANHRARVIEIVAERFGERWIRWTSPHRDDPLPARLPQSPEECHGVRVWHALTELGAGEAIAGRERPAQILADVRRRERLLLDDDLEARIGRAPTTAESASIAALVAGLRQQLILPDGIAHSDAAQAIATALAALAEGQDRRRPASPWGRRAVGVW